MESRLGILWRILSTLDYRDATERPNLAPAAGKTSSTATYQTHSAPRRCSTKLNEEGVANWPIMGFSLGSRTPQRLISKALATSRLRLSGRKQFISPPLPPDLSLITSTLRNWAGDIDGPDLSPSFMRPSQSRSRYGCKTCRTRKVKCDESMPSCVRCTETGRKCDGPSSDELIIRPYSHKPQTSPQRVTIARRVVSGPFSYPEESRAFDFYLQRAAPALGGYLDTYLWQVLLPQLSLSDITVKHAVLAIATLCEHPLLEAYHPPPVGLVYTDDQRRGVKWYSKSVSSFVARPPDEDELKQVESGLLTCLLFTSVEIQHANVNRTVTLLEHGFKLVARQLELRRGSHPQASSWILDLVLPTLVRQTVNFGIFGHALSPDAYTAVDQLIPSEATKISSLSEARDSIYAIIIRSFMFVQDTGVLDLDDPETRTRLQVRQERLLRWLQIWSIDTTALMSTRTTVLSHQEHAVFHTLSCWHEVGYLWLSRCLNSRNNSNKGLLHGDEEERQCFHRILHHAETALRNMTLATSDPSSWPFTLELGVMPPLYFVGWQCRDLDLCRHAIALMRRCPAQENLFVTELQVRAVESMLAVEERRLALNALWQREGGGGEADEENPELAARYRQQARLLDEVVDRSLSLPRSRPLILDWTEQ